MSAFDVLQENTKATFQNTDAKETPSDTIMDNLKNTDGEPK